ncbi:hypothetical protein [Rhodococcus sp. Q]|uniref:hypothetical protein n=1 Tax=Rhodococcus sp. Q TaxID=2502252 RepID=UPI0010F8511A|nr:hypothetical protein [Rhodococcus sp. Q]
MNSLRKNTARLGASTALAATALLALPALASATVEGTASVDNSGDRVVVQFTGVTSPSLDLCWVTISNESHTAATANPALILGNPGTGTFVSDELAPGKYLVGALCTDDDGTAVLTPEGGVPVTIGASGGSLGSVGSPISLGSGEVAFGLPISLGGS